MTGGRFGCFSPGCAKPTRRCGISKQKVTWPASRLGTLQRFRPPLCGYSVAAAAARSYRRRRTLRGRGSCRADHLSPDDEARWRRGAAIPIGTEDLPALLDGDQDVWLAACSGFHNSPFGKAGSPCPQPFWGCLECRNAVITACKLPVIFSVSLLYLKVNVCERGGLGQQVWSCVRSYYVG